MSDFYNKYPYTDFHELNLDWVIERVKKLTEDWLATQQEWNDTEEQWQQLYDYVHNYFDNLDVQQEINTKIDELISSGEFVNILTPVINASISTSVGEWIQEHLTPTTPPVDDTLSIKNAAADSEIVGNILRDISETTDNLLFMNAQSRNNVSVVSVDKGYKINAGSVTSGTYAYMNGTTDIYLHLDAGTYTFAIGYETADELSNNCGFWYGATTNLSDATNYITRKDATTLNFLTDVYVFFRLANTSSIYSDLVFYPMIKIGDRAEYIPHFTAVDYTVRTLTETPAFIAAENSRDTFTWDVSTHTLSINRNCFVAGKDGRGTAVTAQTADFSSIVTTYESYKILVDESGTVHGKAWNDYTDSHMFCIGLIYGTCLYIAGTNDILNDPIGIVTVDHQNTGYYVWITSSNTIIVNNGGFAVSRNGRTTAVKNQTVDLSSIPTTYNAYKLYLDSSGYIHAQAWNSGTVIGMILIGCTYRKNINIFGVNNVITSKQEVYCFGDSITAGVNCTVPYHLLLGKHDNVICYNYGVGGTGYVKTFTGTAVAGNGVIGDGEDTALTGSNSVLDIMTGKTFSSCIIFAGTNDYGGNVTAADFTQAVQDTLDLALTQTSNILVITPLKRYYNNIPYTQANSAGLVLKDYSDIIKTECASRGIKCFDGFDINLDPTISYIKSRFMSDGLHPNNVGQMRIAGAIRSAFEENCAVL